MLLALVCSLLANTASGDGGTLRRVETVDGYTIAVFTAPAPLVAGFADISVLIQDTATRQYVLDGKLLVHVANVEQPSARRSATATTDLATNKLFRAAHIEFDRPGRWLVNVECQAPRGRSSVAFDVEVEPPRPPWLAMWPWFVWPFAVVGLYVLYETTRHRPRRPTSANRCASAG